MSTQHATFIHVGHIHIDKAPNIINTVLGSCVAVCLYDESTKIGAMNHYLLPFWNGNSLQSPRFGNVAIPKMIAQFEEFGANLATTKAKVFGGAAMNIISQDKMMIGEKNSMVAFEILKHFNIPVVAHDVGGNMGRKIQFLLEDARVLLKYTQKN
jgi:chemotaxis protein CheD